MCNKKQVKPPISFVLLCTVPDQGMKSLGSKSLVKINRTDTFIEKQIKNIRSGAGRREHEIIISCSFDCHKIKKIISSYSNKYNIKLVCDQEENINFGGALLSSIENSKYDDVVFINYGCLFNRNVIKRIISSTDNSVVVTKKSKRNNHISIGCNTTNRDKINHIFYGLEPYKYMDLGYLQKEAVCFLSKHLYYKKHINKFTFEIVNFLIENGFEFDYETMNNQDIVLSNTVTLSKYKKVLEV